jgi:hypothetical protein
MVWKCLPKPFFIAFHFISKIHGTAGVAKDWSYRRKISDREPMVITPEKPALIARRTSSGFGYDIAFPTTSFPIWRR